MGWRSNGKMGTDTGYIIGDIYDYYARAKNAGRSLAINMDESRKNINSELSDDEENFNEMAYVRVKAGDILIRCLEERSGQPMQTLVEALVLAGPENLVVLREILTETNQHKVQVGDDINQVLSGLLTNLRGYDVHLRGLKKASTLAQMKPGRFMSMIKRYGVVDLDVQDNCLRLFKDAQELAVSLFENYSLFAKIEEYLEDWILGVSYQLTHQKQFNNLM